MALSVSQMSPTNLNPHFFAYGQFPLFLTYLTTPKHDFNTIVITLRFWSAFFSSFSVLFFYFIGLNFFKSKKTSFVLALLIIFTPGLIQIAHFGTTESILVFVFTFNTFLSLKIFDQLKYKYLFWASLVSGVGLATKISALILVTPIIISLILINLKKRQAFKFLIQSFLFLIVMFFVGILFSPFNFLDFSNFLSSIKYEIQVANNQLPVFYTHQFIGTIPYLFQFQKIFPYTNGIFVLFFSLLGLFFIPKKNKKNLLILIPSLVFFLYQGQLFVKWTRFMAPIFFIFPFLSVYFFEKIKSTFFKSILILISLLPGIFFLKTYFSPDIRIQSSNWIEQNIPKNSQILSESGNVINLPISNSNFHINNFDFYNQKNIVNLTTEIDKIDYIFVPSRRVFKNKFSWTESYYRQLFSGDLNFHQINQFSNNNSLFLNSENAEETWSVFDNPTVRIFAKNNL
jgi:hypothetical protein